ncbi:hypothetical protein COU20_02885 [Candidatus Kaiserbacteria bacterium CG10_big_fil_rev_8_21_14_0_10_59_10]|uniref:RNA polymerase sigma factor n=1 Tax=Candidatus Kaiserbacteria bacterium CG10_big_fil_rev_8_21_14_0_10_59_10 TaxID=1974612 RepID=A0A2H0U9A2_9BACT|nr:MAG: hypothetical protein COU20_02885 [Candidatus Kaiserbacteria bacterium CG10_big_fil_rev_8_21_14_0_10_59_10]
MQRTPHEEQEAVFLKAFSEYSDKLFRHAVYRTGNRERAVELAQDTFLKAWDYVQKGGEVRQLRSFLYRILNNLIIDEYRKSKEQSLDELLEDDTGALERTMSEGDVAEAEETLDKNAAVGRIREIIPRLPEAYRTAVTLRYVDGLTPKEIAALLNVSENVVSVRIHRGVAKLKSLCASIHL